MCAVRGSKGSILSGIAVCGLKGFGIFSLFFFAVLFFNLPSTSFYSALLGIWAILYLEEDRYFKKGKRTENKCIYGILLIVTFLFLLLHL